MQRRELLKAVGLAGLAAPWAARPAQAQLLGEAVASEDALLRGPAHHAPWGRHGAVAAADMQASLVGQRILAQGGNAIDAAVAMAAALNVVEPYSTGIGGWGGYMMIYLAREKRVVCLDYIGLSPQAASAQTLTEKDFKEGYRAPVVPGNVGGWSEALARHGTLSLGDALEPAIELAEDGFVVTEYDAEAFAALSKKLAQFPTSARVFMPEGRPLNKGQTLTQKQLAASLRRIAKDGAEICYRGELAQTIVRFLKKHGGLLTLDDFAAWTPRWREPISIPFQGYSLHAPPPGSCALTMFQVLNILEGLDLKALSPYGVDFAHHWIEAMQLAFLDDDAYNTGKDVEIPVARLTSKEYAKAQRERIRPDKVAAHRLPALGTDGTTSFSAVDRWGNMVACSESLVNGFGSGVVAADTGILLNNGHQYGFVLDAGHVNSLAGRQHPKGLMCPTLVVKDGQALLGVGAAGGYTIPQTVGQVLIKVLTYGMDVQQAIASPRLMMSRSDGRVPSRGQGKMYTDRNYPAKTLDGLRALGHVFADSGNEGGVQGVGVHPQTRALYAGADPRRDGHPIAF